MPPNRYFFSLNPSQPPYGSHRKPITSPVTMPDILNRLHCKYSLLTDFSNQYLVTAINSRVSGHSFQQCSVWPDEYGNKALFFSICFKNIFCSSWDWKRLSFVLFSHGTVISKHGFSEYNAIIFSNL